MFAAEDKRKVVFQPKLNLITFFERNLITKLFILLEM